MQMIRELQDLTAGQTGLWASYSGRETTDGTVINRSRGDRTA